MNGPSHLLVRGTLGALRVRATPRLGQSRSVTLGVYVPRSAPRQRRFLMKEAVARDVRAFALANAAASGAIVVPDAELRTLIQSELMRECGVYLVETRGDR